MSKLSDSQKEFGMTWSFIEFEANLKVELLRAKMLKSVDDVLEEVGVLIATHFFSGFTVTKSSTFLKMVITHQSAIDMKLIRNTSRTLN